MPASDDVAAPAVDARPAATRAYDWTRRAVLSGEIDSGDLITEGEVAEAVGVSRTPVREAFLRLQSEGVLRLYPKRGALVVPVTTAEINNVVEARLLIEPWAFALVAGGVGASALSAELRSLIEVQARCLRLGDDAGFQEADGAFHARVVAAVGNRLVAEFYRSLRDRQLRLGAIATRIDTERAAHILDEHRALADAVADGDRSRAASLATDHIDATGASLRAGRSEFT